MTKTQESPAEVASATDTFALVHPGLIVPDPNNVRDELTDIDDLAASIFQLGLQQPLRVRFVPSGFLEHDPTCAVYVVIAGHRRLAALRSLMERELWDGDVPCMIAPENTSADDVTAAMLVENLQRSDLNPVEEGHAFERLDLAAIASSGARVDQALAWAVVQRQHLVPSDQADPRLGQFEVARLCAGGCSGAGCQRCARLLPGLQAAVEDGDCVMTGPFQQPPEPAAEVAAVAVVDHHLHAAHQARAAQPVAQPFAAGKRVAAAALCLG